MKIRPAVTSDIPALAALWADAFPGERTVEQRIRQLEAGGVYGGVETAWIATDAHGAAGGFRAYALQQYVYGAAMPMMGLAAVAVRPAARRLGLGAQLCRVALRHAFDRGDVISVLYPFRPSYYAALGWALTGSLHSHHFAPASLRITHPQPRVHIETDAAIEIAPCYERAALRSNGRIARTSRIWRQHLDWPGVEVCVLRRPPAMNHASEHAADDDCCGYALVQRSANRTDGGQTLIVRELVADDVDAFNELLSWISLQRDDVSAVTYDALASARFDLRLVEPRTPHAPPARVLFAPVATVLRGPMSRIVNLRAALERRTYPSGLSSSMRLIVSDDILAENNGVFDVHIGAGCGVISHAVATEGARADRDTPALRCDIATMTQIYLGELSVAESIRLGRATATGGVDCIQDAFIGGGEYMLFDEF